MVKLPNYSVVIPLYNHEKFLVEAVESAVKQTHPPIQIIIVNDGSTDGSLKRAETLALTYPSVLVLNQKNSGAHAAINRGISQVTSEYVAILNSDDIYERTRFAHLFEETILLSDADILTSKLRFIDADSNLLPDMRWYRNALRFYRLTRNLPIALINANFAMTTSNFLFKRALLDQIGGFGDYRYAHDLEFLLRAIRAGGTVHINSKSLIKYRFHSTNTIAEGREKIFTEVSTIGLEHVRAVRPRFRTWALLLGVSILNRYAEIFIRKSLERLRD